MSFSLQRINNYENRSPQETKEIAKIELSEDEDYIQMQIKNFCLIAEMLK